MCTYSTRQGVLQYTKVWSRIYVPVPGILQLEGVNFSFMYSIASSYLVPVCRFTAFLMTTFLVAADSPTGDGFSRCVL